MRISKLIFGLTYRCQCRCRHCSAGLYPVASDEELTTAEVKQVIASVVRLGARAINLFGGEASLRRDFFEIVQYAGEKAPEVIIDSNGQTITESVAARLLTAKVSMLFVSLDGATAERHDAFQRLEGSYAGVLRALAACRAVGLPFHVSTCAIKGYVRSGELAEIARIARDAGAGGLRVALPMCSGIWLNDQNTLLDEEEAALVRELARDGFVYLVEEEGGCFTRCKAVSAGSLYISPYGEVQPCNFIPVSYGNLRREPLEFIIERMSDDAFFRGRHVRGECPMRKQEVVGLVMKHLNPASQLVHKPGPVGLFLGGACSADCGFCRREKEPLACDFASVTAAVEAWPEAPLEVALYGGDAALYPQLEELIVRLRRGGSRVILHSGALPFAADPARALRLAKAGLDMAEVFLFSFDGPKLAQITGQTEALARSLRGIEALARAGVQVRVTLFETDPALVREASAVLRGLGAWVVLLGQMRRLADPEAQVCFGPATQLDVSRRILWHKQWEPPQRLVPPKKPVVLVFPDCESQDPVLQLPMSLLHLAAPLVADGQEVVILDQRLTPDWKAELAEVLKSEPICLGISCFISRQVANASEVARYASSLQGDLPIVWGGVHPSLLPQQTLESPYCDVVVRGEGEETFALYLAALREGREPAGIAGLSFKRANGEIIHNPDRPPLNMDTLPPIPYDLVSLERYQARGLLWGALHQPRLPARLRLLRHRKGAKTPVARAIGGARGGRHGRHRGPRS